MGITGTVKVGAIGQYVRTLSAPDGSGKRSVECEGYVMAAQFDPSYSPYEGSESGCWRLLLADANGAFVPVTLGEARGAIQICEPPLRPVTPRR
jgi:hypothetical protein